MKHYLTNEIKNIALVGSSGSGKTTLAECMMYEGGLITRMGSVEDKNTVSDYHELEHERGSSVFSSIMHTEWRGTKINLIDTPGLDDFIGEIIPAMRIANTAVLTLNAQYGVEVGTEIIWRYLQQYNKPAIFVITQVDHSKADYNAAIEQAKERFGNAVVQVQYPYNPGEGFNAIIDVLKMVMYKFPEKGGKPEKLPIPEAEKERAEELHNALVEAAAENDENLMELYFDKGELDEDEMRQGIRLGMLERNIFPVFCVAAKQNMGSGRLMGFIGNVAPSAGDVAPEITTEGEEIKISDPDTTLFVFKSSNEKHTGSMSYFKVCSGELVAGTEFTNTTTRTKGKINQIYVVNGKNRSSVDKLSAGDIGATVKLKDTFINHTLRPKDDGVMVEPIKFPEPKIRTAIAPENNKEEEKMGLALNKLKETDPTLISGYRRELKQTIMEGQGALHLSMAKWQLENIHGVKVKFDKPRISYRETIQKAANGYYKHKKQSGGAGQYGEVYLAVQPYSEHASPPGDFKVRDTQEIELDWGGKLVFNNCIVGGVIDNRFMPAILKGIMEVMEEGPITGSYCRDVMVYVYDGKMHPVDSNEISFKIAGAQAFKQAFLDAKPKLLEPVYKVEILVPSEFTGDIMTDIQQRRAIPQGIESEGRLQKIVAHVPLAELYQYATTLSSITQGRGTHTREFLEYATVPADIQAKLAEQMRAEKELA
ncbi:MAG: elongation factor G [Bacteroidetes bacterium]|nr:MAG: elongation factor G [Bacteroidota bacterium]